MSKSAANASKCEAIRREVRLRQRNAADAKKLTERQEAILKAVREVAGAVTSSTLTTVAVFLPIGLVGGLVGQLFGAFSLTVTAALLASLLVSLTVVPVLSYWFLRAPKDTPDDDIMNHGKIVR